jgi:hypothetical protein
MPPVYLYDGLVAEVIHCGNHLPRRDIFFIKPQMFPSGQGNTPLKWEWLANKGREGSYKE